MCLKYKKTRAGFTILEMVIALTIMGIIFSVMVVQFSPLRKSWETSKANNEIIQNARVLADHINRSLSKAAQITAVSSPASEDGYLEFQDAESNLLRYEVGDDNYINYGQTGNTVQLAGPVSSLNFKCYSLEDFDTATTDSNSIRYVKTNVTFTNQSEDGQDKEFTTSVFIQTNKQGVITAGSRLAVSERIGIAGWNTIIDSFNSSEGDYGPTNRSSNAIISTNSTNDNRITLGSGTSVLGDAYVGPGGEPDEVIYKSWGAEITGTEGALTSEVPMPTISPPTDPPFDGSPENGLFLSGHRTEVVNNDRYLRYLYLYGSSRLRINQDVTIVVDGDIIIYPGAKIELHQNASLNLYAKDGVYLLGDINANTADPTKVNIYLTASNEYMLMYLGSKVYAAVNAPYCDLYVYYGSDFFGTFAGRNFYSLFGDTHLDLDLPAVGGGSEEILP